MQIFKFKQGKLSGDCNNDEKHKATKGTKMYKICSEINMAHKPGGWGGGGGVTPQIFWRGGGGGGGGYKKPGRAVYNK